MPYNTSIQSCVKIRKSLKLTQNNREMRQKESNRDELRRNWTKQKWGEMRI